jgi:hypothetical protein
MKHWQDHLKVKVLLEVIFRWQIIMHNKFIPDDAMVNKNRYGEVLTSLWEAVYLMYRHVYTGSEACPVDTDGSFPGDEMARA